MCLPASASSSCRSSKSMVSNKSSSNSVPCARPSALSACSAVTMASGGTSPICCCSGSSHFSRRIFGAPASLPSISDASELPPSTSSAARPASITWLSQWANRSVRTPLLSANLPPSFSPVRLKHFSRAWIIFLVCVRKACGMKPVCVLPNEAWRTPK